MAFSHTTHSVLLTSGVLSHTKASGDDGALYVLLSDTVPSGVTYGVAAMTLLVSDTTLGVAHSAWRLVSPASGAQSITPSGAGTVYGKQAVSGAGIDTAAPVDDSGVVPSSSPGSAAAEFGPTLTGSTDGLIYTFAINSPSSGTDLLTPGAGQTLIYSSGGSSDALGAKHYSSHEPAGASVRGSYVKPSGGTGALSVIAIALKAAGGGGGSSIAPHAMHYRRRRAA